MIEFRSKSRLSTQICSWILNQTKFNDRIRISDSIRRQTAIRFVTPNRISLQTGVGTTPGADIQVSKPIF